MKHRGLFVTSEEQPEQHRKEPQARANKAQSQIATINPHPDIHTMRDHFPGVRHRQIDRDQPIMV